MIFKGTATALITPFTEDDKVDEKALCNIVEHQIASGVNALVALGTTAETATLSEEEKKQIISLCVRQTRGRVPILVGAGSNSTAHAVESCRIAQECGADGLLVVTPYYNKCTQEGLVRHYGAIAHSTSLSLVCYNVPSRTGVNMLPETFARICEENKKRGGHQRSKRQYGANRKVHRSMPRKSDKRRRRLDFADYGNGRTRRDKRCKQRLSEVCERYDEACA